MEASSAPREAQNRVRRAKEREIAAHRRAIDLHESAARIFERHGNDTFAGAARRRAQNTRDMLALALREQEDLATTTGHPHAHASLGLPPEGTTAAVGGGSGDRESARTDDKTPKGTG